MSNFNSNSFALENDTIQLSDLSIIENTVSVKLKSGKLIAASTYNIDAINARLVWLAMPVADSVIISYRCFPFKFNKHVFTNDYNEYKNYTDSSGFLINTNRNKFDNLNNRKLVDFGKLSYGGDFSRGLSFGNGQNFSLNSSFNLQLAGNLSKDIVIKAAITDNNIPIQPEGNTANLQDFDKIYVQIAYKDHQLRLGDIDLKSPKAYFMRFQKNLQGFSYSGTQKIVNNYVANAMASISIARGSYTINNLIAEEGNQGPYKLSGANGESFIIVLSGSERVFIDGELMKRGANNDYTIDYNLGEIQFTPKRLITKNLRIKVEFEYSSNNYFRYLYHLNAGVKNKIWSFDANFYSEQDLKNQPVNQSLTNESESLLMSIGDSLNNAYFTGARATTFDENRVLYEKIDTFIDGLSFSIYRYSTDSTKNLYALSFSFLGKGKGNYEPIQSVANGAVYAWQKPNTNAEPQGSYEPVVLLITPKQKQLLTTRFTIAPSKNTVITSEFAFSNQDQNTFSTIDNDDDIGLGAFLHIKDRRALKKDSSLYLTSEVQYEFKQKNFLPLERYRNIEFQRNWNANDSIKTDQHLGFSEAKLEFSSNSYFAYRISFFAQNRIYTGIEHQIKSHFEIKNWEATTDVKYLHSNSLEERTQFLRPKIAFSKKIKKLNDWKLGVNAYNEYNTIKSIDFDSLENTSFWWQDYTVFASSPDSLYSKYKISYNLRLEHLPTQKTFEPAYLRAQTVSIEGVWKAKKNQSLNWTLNYRNLQQDTLLKANDDIEHFYLGRIQYRFSALKGFFVGNSLYEIGSGREQKIQYNYVQAPDGQGNYAWQDINENGIQELNEFYVSTFQNENIYLRLINNSLEFQAVNTTKFNQSLQINPKRIWFNQKGVKGFLARFSNSTSISLNKKIFAGRDISFTDIVNPIFIEKNDSILVSNSNNIRNILFFNRSNSVYAIDYVYAFNENVNLLTSGFEKRFYTTHALKIRWNISQNFTWISKYTNGFKQNDSDFYFDRRYAFVLNEVETDFSWLYNKTLRLALNYRYAFRSNPQKIKGQQFAVINEAGFELKYTKAANYSILAKFRYSSVAYNDSQFKNEQLQIDMLQNLQNGNNFVWMLSFDKTIAKNFQFSLVYDGRKTGEAKIIHTGRAQVRAIF